jgi:hypothetical protein
VRWWFAVALAACGRIDFDPVTTAGDGRLGDGSGGTGDGAPGDSASGACATAIPVQVGTPITIDTCSGADLLDGCGPAATKEVVFRFAVPTTAGYTIRAYDSGTQNVSNSTGAVDAGCTATTQCTGILGQGYTAGEVVFFAVEASSGGCAMIDFAVD